jgi:hypothetical protein
MIDWLEEQGYGPLLWDFVIACCRREWDELPGEPFRRLVDHVEQVGIRDLEDALHEASRALKKLERRLRRSTNCGTESKLNRQFGHGNMILAAFDQQDGASAARSMSADLFAWAEDSTAEARSQADSLRQLVPDPSRRYDGAAGD